VRVRIQRAAIDDALSDLFRARFKILLRISCPRVILERSEESRSFFASPPRLGVTDTPPTLVFERRLRDNRAALRVTGERFGPSIACRKRNRLLEYGGYVAVPQNKTGPDYSRRFAGAHGEPERSECLTRALRVSETWHGVLGGEGNPRGSTRQERSPLHRAMRCL
jgi:hypothetical protein